MARSEITEDQVRDLDFLSEEEGTTISGVLQVQIDAKPDNLLELDDTPDTYSSGLYLKATTSGVEWATASGGSGTFNHSELNELDYASSGHSGFSPTIHTHTEADITDLDKYTTAEVDTISGTLQNTIDNLDYYTTGEVDTISGSLSAEIDSDISIHTSDANAHHNELHTITSHSDTTASGSELDELTDGSDTSLHIHDNRYYTETELDAGQLDNRYYIETEVDTISGSLQANIDAKPDNFLELDDTPDVYDEGKHVKSTSSGIEFADTTFLELSDTLTTYSGHGTKYARVSVDESYIDFDYMEWDAEEAPLIPETAISGTYFVNFEGGRLLIGATGNKPDLVYNGPIAGLAFDATKIEACYGVFKIPYAWNTESNIKATVSFMIDDTQTGVKTCLWRLDYHCYAEEEIYSNKTTTTINVNTILPDGVVGGTYLTEELNMSYNDVNNPLARGDMVTFKFYRDGSAGADDMKGDSILLALMFELKVGQNISGG